MEWQASRICTAFKSATASLSIYTKGRHAALEHHFGADLSMDLIIHYLFYEVLWFFIGLFIEVDRAEKAEKDLAKVKDKVAALIKGREHELSNLSNKIIKIFRQHRFKIIEQTEEEIVFRHRFKNDERVTMRLH